MEDGITVLYSEIKQTLSSLSVTLYDSRFMKIHTEPLEVEVEGSTVSVSDHKNEIKFLLSDIEFSPLTCRGLKLSPFNELNFTMQIDSASWKTIKPQKFDCKQSCQQELIEKIQLYQDKCFCTKCGYKIITNHSFFKRVLPLPSDNWSTHTDMWFCHNHGTEDTGYKSISLLPKSQECFISNTYFLVRAKHLNVKDHQNGAITCPRCHTKIGARVIDKKPAATNGHVDSCENPVYKIFQQAVLFNSDDLSEPTNIRPITSTESFYAKLINEQSHLNTSFRLILNGEEANKKIHCLIWLMDPNMLIFQGMATEEKKEVKLKPTPVMKILYKCLMVDLTRPGTGKSDVLDQWNKDNSVHAFQLPYHLCISLVTSLANSTKLLPKTQRYVNSFLLGFLHYDR